MGYACARTTEAINQETAFIYRTHPYIFDRKKEKSITRSRTRAFFEKEGRSV